MIDNRINYTENTLFIHIPKTGGTSICKELGIKRSSHITAIEILRSKSCHVYNKRYSFCVVRNPIDRFISLFNYAKKEISYYHNNINPEKSLYGPHLDYKILKDASIDECAVYLSRGLLRHDKNWNQWLPQSEWVYLNHQLLIDKYYKLENIQELERDLSALFGRDICLPKMNSSSSNEINIKIRNSLSAKSYDYLYQYYERDFINFNY